MYLDTCNHSHKKSKHVFRNEVSADLVTFTEETLDGKPFFWEVGKLIARPLDAR